MPYRQWGRLGINLFNKAKEEIRLPLEKLEDLINHKEALLATHSFELHGAVCGSEVTLSLMSASTDEFEPTGKWCVQVLYIPNDGAVEGTGVPALKGASNHLPHGHDWSLLWQ